MAAATPPRLKCSYAIAVVARRPVDRRREASLMDSYYAEDARRLTAVKIWVSRFFSAEKAIANHGTSRALQ